ncbi:Ubiquinone biosynthesis O-methyltransferase [subsurface metagenome]
MLDIGCGDGGLLLRLRNKYREVWGIDIAQPRIDRIQKKFGNESNIHIRVEDINEKIDFEDGFFDTITVVSVLEHVFDPYHLIRECHRLLCVGGCLIVQVPNVANAPNRMRLLIGKLPVTTDNLEGEGWDGGHLHYFTRASLKKLFENEGFKVIKVTNGGIFARQRRVCGSLLGADILVVGIKE